MADKAQIIEFLLIGYRNDDTDLPLEAGTVEVYEAGTSTPAYVWTDRNKTLPTTAGIATVTLDDAGRAEIYGDGLYKFVIKTAAGATVETVDYFQANSGGGSSVDTYTGLRAAVTSGAIVVKGRAAVGDGGAGTFVWNPADLSTEVTADAEDGIYVAPTSDTTGASGAWVRLFTGDIHLAWFGADPAGVEDAQPAFVAAIAASVAQDAARIIIPRGDFRVNSTIPILRRGLTFKGSSYPQRWVPSGGGGIADLHGTQIQFYGTGEMFEIGTDNGLAWDTAAYDGYQEIVFEDVYLNHGDPDTVLDNAAGSYAADTYGIRDWRGGSLILRNVTLSNFDHPFWGIHSDINNWSDVIVKYCHSGFYFGPRSDQATIYRLYAFLNDRVFDIDKCHQLTLYNPVFVANGSANDYAVNVRKGSKGLTMYNPWLEHASGNVTGTKPFIGIGMENGYLLGDPAGNTANVLGVRIYNPTIFTVSASGDLAMPYIVEIADCNDVKITDPTVYGGFYNFTSLVHVTNSDSECHIEFSDDRFRTLLYTLSGTGTSAEVSAVQTNKYLFAYGGRVYMRQIPEHADTSVALVSETSRRFSINYPESGRDHTEFVRFARRDLSAYLATAAGDPPTETWARGDRYTFTDPAASGFIGKVCTVSGTQGTYEEGLTCTTNGTTTVVLSDETEVLKKGMILTINATVIEVVSITGTAMVVSAVIAASGPGTAIAYRNATFKEYGAISA